MNSVIARPVLWSTASILAITAVAGGAETVATTRSAGEPVVVASAADQATPAVSAPAPDQSGGPAVTAAARDDIDGSDAIVVTALRRSENLQRTPAAVTVVSGDLLQRQQIVDVRGIQSLVPAARFSAANTSTRIFIRGVGSQLDFYWIPETTAVNINGVYAPRFATTGALYDIDSVQVLPGPQGVLYGRSAGGGVVVINTRKPTDKNEASGLLEYGNYNTFRFEGMTNLRVSDTLSIRAAGVYNRHDGYESFDLQSDKSYALRLSAQYRPTDKITLNVWGTRYEQRGNPQAVAYLPLAPGVDPYQIPANDPVTGRSNVTGSRNAFQYTSAGYDLSVDLGPVKVDNLGSVLRQTERSLRKLIGSDQINDNAQTQFTDNLHFSGGGGAFEWIAGVDWLYAKSRLSSLLGPNRLGSIFPTIRQTSLGGFAQGTLTVTHGIRIVGGARDTRDSLFLDGTTSRCFGPCVLPPVTFSKAWYHLDLKGGVEADIAPKVLVYANVQTGYAPGTVNVVVANGTTPPPGVSREINPQTLLAYTAGEKATLNNGLITLNLEGFYYNYKQLIIQSFVTGLNQQTLFNAPRATVYGLQVTSALHPTERDVLSINVAYTHARYGDFQATPIARNIGGLQLTYTPDWTASLSYDHRFDLANGGRIDARASAYLSDSYWGTFDHSANARQGAYTKTDLSLTYHPANDKFTAGLWVKNVENNVVGTAPASTGFAAPFAGATFLEPPRTFGFTLGVKL